MNKSNCNRCDKEILWDVNVKNRWGKMIPMDLNHKRHECRNHPNPRIRKRFNRYYEYKSYGPRVMMHG